MKSVLRLVACGFRSGMTVALAVVIFLSGLLLCCQVGLTSIRGTQSKAKSCCHMSESVQVKGKAHKVCECCGFSKNVFNIAQESIKAVRTLALSDLYPAHFAIGIFRVLNADLVFVSAGHGPPRTNSQVPLYLQHSNLRL